MGHQYFKWPSLQLKPRINFIVTKQNPLFLTKARKIILWRCVSFSMETFRSEKKKKKKNRERKRDANKGKNEKK